MHALAEVTTYVPQKSYYLRFDLNDTFGSVSVVETLPHGKCCYSAPQIARDTNDGDSESWEQELQARVSFVVASYDRYVGESRWKFVFGKKWKLSNAHFQISIRNKPFQ